MTPTPHRKLTLVLFAAVQLVAIFADRLKQFSFVGMVGILEPGSTVELLKLNLFMHVPMLFFAPLLGTLLDRWNKTGVIVFTGLVRGAILLLLPAAFMRTGSLYSFYVGAFFISIADLMFAPARSALIPELVERERLLQVNALFWGLGIVGTTAGFLIGGWLFDFKSWQLSFQVDSVAYIAAACVMFPVLFLSGWKPEVKWTRPSALSPFRLTVWGWARWLQQSIKEAVDLMRQSRSLAVCLKVQCALFSVGGVLSVVAIAHIQEVAPVGKAFFLSIIVTAMLAGLLAGSGMTGFYRERASTRRTIAVGTLLTGVAVVGFARTDTIIPLSIWAALLGVSISPVFIVTETLLQTHSPDRFRGRVFAAREVLIKTGYLAAAVAGTGATAFVTKETVLIALGLFLALLGVTLERTKWLEVE